MQGLARLYLGMSLGLFIFFLYFFSIIYLVLTSNLITDMRPQDLDALKKTMAQKWKAWVSTSAPKRVMFIELEPREAPIKLDSPNMADATSKAATIIVCLC